MKSPRAGFVGLPVERSERSQVLLYRLDVEGDVGEVEGGVWIHLFAETRYRLWVNGKFVSSGPARFVQSSPWFDSVDLGPYLTSDSNCIAVEVHHYGCSSFQTMPGGRDGFIAWGGGDGFEFKTPGNWKVRSLPGWAKDAALYSFALNACEIRDTRATEDAWYLPGALSEGWEAARPLPAAERVWGELAPRNVPMPLFERAEPDRLVVSGELADIGHIFGLHFPDTYLGPPGSIEKGLSKAFQFWVASDEEQTVAFWYHWGTYWVNGDRIGEDAEELAGLRMVSEVSLKKGWNCFCGFANYPPNTVYWDCLFRLPHGLRVSAFPEDDCEDRLRVSPLISEEERCDWVIGGEPRNDAGWVTAEGDPRNITPARLMAWQRLRNVSEGDPESKRGLVWVFDFGREVLGHVEIEIEGGEGQVLDVGFDEWQQPSGLIDLYRTNPFVHTVDRYILRGGGSQKIVGLNPRGGRFVQVVVYPPIQKSSFQLKAVRIIETRTMRGAEGSFSDGDPIDEAIWSASLNTVIGSAEDVYSDSPWRERGAYIGDFTVNQLVQCLIGSDLRIAKRCLQLFAQAQRDDGQFACVAPAYHRMAHEDFSLIWVLGLWEHWSLTGDTFLVDELWPNLERLWASSVWHENAAGLWGTEGMNLFIDWGVVLEEREGQANAVLNAFRIHALEKSASLARSTGREKQAESFFEEAQRIRAAFSSTLWVESEGRYAACTRKDGTLSSTSSGHANLLAWAFEIGTANQLGRVQEYLFDFLDRNYEKGIAEGRFAGHIELYFFRYLLSALAERGHGERALRLIRQHWGPLVKDGFGTLPECFHRFQVGLGSRCHGWSGYPAVWYTKWVLGLRQEKSGDPDRWVLDPLRVERIEHASGVQPHRLGTIRVEWERKEDGNLEMNIAAPEGVSVRCAECL
ncbi:family 78 glycoside hydrolase catalytic domain [Pelagicoccus sp. SDUM812002]|uniref:family 78 glycoside hydrolase catalytic domain n=1 Tax=Pelagicoccus sp. SDUM812002 TaxID=3041266 RepID=UPI00280D1F89|nr:family 78 glycoside hydrolase catalytic domain [Pelagicoccus sp. SDUM812002]MDQ8184650.1 family 78 glycoside hydrolase catalytic domain [Pelagicoccus sp. SDUM812002]